MEALSVLATWLVGARDEARRATLSAVATWLVGARDGAQRAACSRRETARDSA